MSAATAPSIRDYDNERMRRIALAFWCALLVELKDDEGRVYLPMGEIEDAAALLLATLLSTAPQSEVPSQLRQHCADIGRNVERRTKLAKANPDTRKIFDVVLDDRSVFQ